MTTIGRLWVALLLAGCGIDVGSVVPSVSFTCAMAPQTWADVDGPYCSKFYVFDDTTRLAIAGTEGDSCPGDDSPKCIIAKPGERLLVFGSQELGSSVMFGNESVRCDEACEAPAIITSETTNGGS